MYKKEYNRAGLYKVTKSQMDYLVANNLLILGGEYIVVDHQDSVISVNGKAGDVELTYSDVNALPSWYVPDWNEIINKPSLTGIYIYRGNVDTYDNLLLVTNPIVGDVYNVVDGGKNYAWDGEQWDSLGGLVDLTGYTKIEDFNAHVSNIVAHVNEADRLKWDNKAELDDIPTKVSELTQDVPETDPTVPSWAKSPTKPSYTKSEVGLGNVDNVKQATKTEFDTHKNDTAVHVTTTDKTNWNAKVEDSDLSGFLLDVSYNNTNHVLTFSRKDLPNKTIDLPLEQLLVGLSYDEDTKELVLELEDGTEQRVPLSDLVVGLVSETQMNTALAGKANTSHTHTIAQITNLQTQLNTINTNIGLKANTTQLTSEVTRLEGEIEDVDAKIPTKVSELTNDAGYITDADIPGSPVISVNGKSGAVVLNADDVGARPSTYTPSVADIPNLPASKITSGAFTEARIPALPVAKITNLQTSLDARVTAASLDLQLLEKQGIRPNGTDLLIVDGKINSIYVSELFVTNVITASNQSEMLNSGAEKGDVVVRTDLNKTFILRQAPATNLSNWVELLTPTDNVLSVNGKTGVVVLGIGDISGLQEQLNARVTTTVFETALEGKVDKNAVITTGTKTKITYDAKGLVTGGADLEATDIPQLPPSKITQDANNRFVSDTEKTTWNGKQNALTAGDGISISGNVISAVGGLTVDTWNDISWTPGIGASNMLFICTGDQDQTVTIPTNATVPFPIGTMITFLLTSSYKVTFSGASGVTLTSMDSLVELKTQYGMASLIKIDTDTWQLVGALE